LKIEPFNNNIDHDIVVNEIIAAACGAT